MTLAFEARYVDGADGIGGEILQVSFDSVPASHDEEERGTPYVLISRNFEFPEGATVEWHDGNDSAGGAEIRALRLKRDGVSITLDRELAVEVSFRWRDREFGKLRSFLQRMVGERMDSSG